MKKYLIVAIVAALATSATAGPEEPAIEMGIGAQTCASFADHLYREGLHTEDMFFDWAQGYMSGVNLAQLMRGIDSKNLNAVSIEDEKKELRGYCNNHPTAPYSVAVIVLFKTLPDIPGSAQSANPGIK